MRISKTLMMSAFAILIGSSAAISQSTPAPNAGRSAPTAKAATDTDKKAISKACSDQATAKGLHGKERKAFRSACKRKGGKAA
jgi:psiF repeat-containing protein